MALPSLDARRARDLIGRFAGVPVLVVGDVMLDRFIVGRAEATALANQDAGIVAGKFGPAIVSSEELLASLK